MRKILWNYTIRKIELVTSPTQGTYNDLKKISYFKNKLKVLFDPIISPSEIREKKLEKIDDIELSNSKFEKFYISIGTFVENHQVM